MGKRTNIVFFFTDDQRFDTIHALGNMEISTPHIDQLVQDGISFTHAHIPCGTSGAVCMPSRAMLHTGRTLFHLDREGQKIPDEHITLGETLQKNGYRCFGTGKWHNGSASYARSFTDGGEIMFGGMGDHWNVPCYSFDPEGKYRETKFVKTPFSSNEVTMRQCDHITCGKHSSELFADATISFIERYDDSRPFFIYLSFMAPHDPRTMPEKFLDMYRNGKVSLPPNFRDEHEFDYGIRDIRDEVLAPYPRTGDDTRRQLAEYYAMITHLDNEIGRVVSALKKKGEYDNTIFILAGDNGLALGQHGLFGKQSCYEHSVRVPLVFAGPGIPKGERSDSFCYLLDIYPTICELLGIGIPATVEGKSLAGVMNGKKKSEREILYFAYTENIRAVKNRRYKLIEYVGTEKTPCRKTQLFDLQNDPWEKTNLADNDSCSAVIGELRKEMLRLRDEWDDMKNPLGRKFWDRMQMK